MNTDTIMQFLRSRTFVIVIAIFCGLVVIMGTFSVGMMVGYQRARFSYAWGENYHQNFAGPKNGFFHEMDGREFIDAHGTFGQILVIDLATGSGRSTTLVVKGREGVEKIILVDAATVLRRMRDDITVTDLKPGDDITVIGEPTSTGQIQAKLVRVMSLPARLPLMSPRR